MEARPRTIDIIKMYGGFEMNQRTAFLIAACLTAFVLVIGGAVAGRISQANEASAAQAVNAVTIAEMDASPESQVFMEREAAYQDLIQDANERLNKMYSQTYGNAPDASVKQFNEHYHLIYAQDPANAPAYAFSLLQAAQIALQAAPGAVLLQPPELVDFQGIVAYEVILDIGTVYIDANTGEILYNGISVPPSNTQASTVDNKSNDPHSIIGDHTEASGGGQGRDDESSHEDSHEHEDEPEHEGGDD
jgi:uncharacterized membrane protein YkoI